MAHIYARLVFGATATFSATSTWCQPGPFLG